MARSLGRFIQGIAKQLLAGSPSGMLQEGAPLAATANALRNPTQQCWMHSPACSAVASSAHSYHGSRDDEEEVKRNNNDASTNDPQTSDTDAAVTRQMEAIQEEIRKALKDDQQFRDVSQLPEHIARQFMRDPLGMILSSQGVPMGISLKVNPQKLMKHRQQQIQRQGEADKKDWQELLGDSRSKGSCSSEEHHTAVPRTDAQLLKLKLAEVANKLVKEARRSKRTSKQQPQESSSQSMLSSSSEAENQEAADSQGQTSVSAVGQQVKEQLQHLMAAVDQDSWGTTKQSPAEIAQHIADSNRALGGGGGGDEDGEGSDSDDEPLELSDMEQRYADQSAVSAELKEMDEIYEVLAKVPWLDDDDVDERELRGVVAVGLLGTLEEVGWQLRQPLLSLWAGERDLDKLTKDVGPREAAALTAILYHTEQLEQEFNKPPAEGVAAALAAAGASGATQAVAAAETVDVEEGTK